MTTTIARHRPREHDDAIEAARTIRRLTLAPPDQILRELNEMRPAQLARIAALLLLGARR